MGVDGGGAPEGPVVRRPCRRATRQPPQARGGGVGIRLERMPHAAFTSRISERCLLRTEQLFRHWLIGVAGGRVPPAVPTTRCTRGLVR